MNEEIEQRIKALTLERKALEVSHNALVQQNQKTNQEFQQTVMQNQTRFAQLSGAIQELTKLITPTTPTQGNNNDNLPTTPDLDNRLAHVRTGGQSEDR
jgi:CRISPR/Cas system endoribonuclease Cas6 (RAMP superfamily)